MVWYSGIYFDLFRRRLSLEHRDEINIFLMIGLLFVDEQRNEMPQTHRRSFDRKLLIGLSSIILLTIPFQVYEKSQIFYPLDRTLGLYKEEFKDQGREYRWGEKVVLIPLEKKGNWVHIPIKLGNPDIKEKPVKVKIFMNRKIIDHLEFNDNKSVLSG